MAEKSKVYVLCDSAGRIIRIDGGYTVSNITGNWVLIDEGEGDRYNLCQNNYLTSPLYTDDGISRWKLDGKKCVLRSDAEINADRILSSQSIPEPVQLVTDEIGNTYRQEIGTDGKIHLALVESYTGELFE